MWVNLRGRVYTRTMCSVYTYFVEYIYIIPIYVRRDENRLPRYGHVVFFLFVIIMINHHYYYYDFVRYNDTRNVDVLIIAFVGCTFYCITCQYIAGNEYCIEKT